MKDKKPQLETEEEIKAQIKEIILKDLNNQLPKSIAEEWFEKRKYRNEKVDEIIYLLSQGKYSTFDL